VDYLNFARDFNAQFPGFETDIHGLVKTEVDGCSEYYVDCVRLEK
jgi:arginine decarboxylase